MLAFSVQVLSGQRSMVYLERVLVKDTFCRHEVSTKTERQHALRSPQERELDKFRPLSPQPSPSSHQDPMTCAVAATWIVEGTLFDLILLVTKWLGQVVDI